MFVPRCSLRSLILLVAVVACILGGVQLWQRSQHYRRQAALCAWFELEFRDYAARAMEEDESDGLSADERHDEAMALQRNVQHYNSLRRVYARVAHYPWETLPPDVPVAVNPWDLNRCSTVEIEEMVRDWDVKEP